MVMMVMMKMTVRKVMINLQSPHHRWRSSCASSSGKTRGTRYIQCGRCRTIDSHDNEEEEEEMEEDGDDDDDDDGDDDEDYDVEDNDDDDGHFIHQLKDFSFCWVSSHRAHCPTKLLMIIMMVVFVLVNTVLLLTLVLMKPLRSLSNSLNASFSSCFCSTDITEVLLIFLKWKIIQG